MIKRRIAAILMMTALALSVAGLSGCLLMPTEEDELPPPLKEPVKPRFDVYTVGRSTLLEERKSTGRYVYSNTTDLAFAPNGGTLQYLYVMPGEKVAEGQVLAALMTDDLDGQLNRAQRELQRVMIENQRDRVRCENEIKRAERDIARQEERYLTMDAHREMYTSEEIREAKLRLDEMREDIVKTYGEYGPGGFTMAESQLRIEAAQQTIDRLRVRLAETVIVSPIDGEVVYMREMNVGEWVAPNTTMYQVADTSYMDVETTDATFIRYIELGSRVSVVPVGSADKARYPSTVVSMPRRPDDSNDQPQPKAHILPDEFPASAANQGYVEVIITLSVLEDVITIPRSSVQSFDGRTYVMLLRDGLREEVDVVVGMETATEAEITLGLVEGDLVILRG
ncbi:MAG: efflux RND transporter periplasmic adaptor subunit [Oscillospiraceae bacterium]|nr:efflux RND transporter periplasmic adaptor subunit [Oscillospiraceae bacterium]